MTFYFILQQKLLVAASHCAAVLFPETETSNCKIIIALNVFSSMPSSYTVLSANVQRGRGTTFGACGKSCRSSFSKVSGY